MHFKQSLTDISSSELRRQNVLKMMKSAQLCFRVVAWIENYGKSKQTNSEV